MSKIVSDTVCPKCRETGHDSAGNHLLIFEDGGMHCPRAEYHLDGKPYTVRGSETANTEDYEEEELSSIEDIQALNSGSWPERKLSKVTLEHFGVKVAYDGSRNIEEVYRPVEIKGKTVAYKAKIKGVHNIGESLKGKQIDLFGQSKCTNFWTLYIAEGEEDAMAIWEIAKRKYPNKDFSVVAIRGSHVKAIQDNKEFIEKFKEVVLCLDMDQPGKKGTQDICALLGPQKVWHISEKDANEMLKAGKTEELINALYGAKMYSPAEVVLGGVGLDRLMAPLEEGVRIPSFPKLMSKLHGFREGEMTVILAPPGVGKTTICRDIGYYLNIAGEKILNIYLEEDIEKSQQSYIALDNGVLLPELRANPNILTRPQWEQSYNKLIDTNCTMWVDHFGSLNPDKVMEIFRYADSQGFKYGILDHISMVFSGLATTNERKEIDLLLTELASFTKGAKMHPIVVSHVKRTNKPLPKDSKGNIQYPYWDTVASDAARGSGAFEQLAWNIVAIEPEVREDGERGRVRLRVLKNREWGELGICDVVKMDRTGKLVPAPDELEFSI